MDGSNRRDHNAGIGAYAGAGGPELPDGHDRFLKTQKPAIQSVDALSGFTLFRIMNLELEPRGEIDPFKNPEQAMAYRYAGHVRRDCVAFRRIVERYVLAVQAGDDVVELTAVMLIIANRWSDQQDFREEWRLA